MNYFYAVLFFAVLGGLYAVLYYWNHRTPVPEGCENLKTECAGCRITSCGHHPSNDIERRENIHG